MTKSLSKAALLLLCAAALFGQAGAGKGKGQAKGQAKGGPPATPRTQAPIDLTGTWVSVVTEDWMFRMVTPPKGEYLGVPLNAAARRIADAWDPAADEASGNACKWYGAASIMRVPGRIRVSWENDTALKIETEAGTQTRSLRFGAATTEAAASWQGSSTASWELAAAVAGQPRRGNLKTITTRLRPGYLRKNGVPYSENAVITEYWDSYTADNGDVWLVVTVKVDDPTYLTTPFVTSSHFKKLPANAPFAPEPCTAR